MKIIHTIYFTVNFLLLSYKLEMRIPFKYSKLLDIPMEREGIFLAQINCCVYVNFVRKLSWSLSKSIKLIGKEYNRVFFFN